MPPRKTRPEEWLRMVAEHAPALREAGVVRFEVEGCRIELSPAEPPSIPMAPEPESEAFNPLEDPATFGDRSGRFVPGWNLQHREDE